MLVGPLDQSVEALDQFNYCMLQIDVALLVGLKELYQG
ncbi:unnamed protein product, partial [marine sediment metagenome]